MEYFLFAHLTFLAISLSINIFSAPAAAVQFPICNLQSNDSTTLQKHFLGFLFSFPALA